MAPDWVWKAISTKSPAESSCCNCSIPPVMEMDCSFALARWPPSAITAAATDPWSCTRGERWLTLDWGKWDIEDQTMPWFRLFEGDYESTCTWAYPGIGPMGCWQLARFAIIPVVTFLACAQRVPWCSRALIRQSLRDARRS